MNYIFQKSGKADEVFSEWTKFYRQEELIDLIEDALGALTCIECDCGRSLDISRHIDRKDIKDWLEKRGNDITLDKMNYPEVK